MYHFLGHSKIQSLINGNIQYELSITEVKPSVLYPSKIIFQIFQSEISEPVKNHPKTQYSEVIFGYENEVIRKDILNYGKTDFNTSYQNISTDEKVLLYCYYNMRKHYFTSYAVFTKIYPSLHETFEDENLIPIFIDLGCGPLTSGLALADLYNQQTNKKLNFSYIGIDIAEAMLRKAKRFSQVTDLFDPHTNFYFFENWNDIPNSLLTKLVNNNNPIIINASYLFANIDSVTAKDLANFINKLASKYINIYFIFQNPNRTDRNIQYNNFKKLISFNLVESWVEKILYKTNPNSSSEPSSEDVYFEILSLKA